MNNHSQSGKKILQINACYKPAYIYGGPTHSVSVLCEQLIKRGWDIEVFSTTANGLVELPVITDTLQDINGVPVRYFKRVTKDHSHFSPRLLLTLWGTVHSFDIVHIHTWWNSVSVLSCVIAHLRNIPVVLSPRGTLSSYSFTHHHSMLKKIVHRFIGEHLLNRCHIHATSEREQEAIEKLLKPKNLFRIHNLINLPVCIPPKIPENKVLNLLFLSRIEPKKGLELLLEALSELPIPYQLTIAGCGNESYIEGLKDLCKQYQIVKYVNWVGFKGHDKFEIMASHHLLVLPSYDESFGNVVVESLSVGTAVLISKEVGLSNYVKKNNLGWICRRDVLSIKNSLMEIYHHPGRLDVIREFAPFIIARQFNGNELIGEYTHMYQQILNQKKCND